MAICERPGHIFRDESSDGAVLNNRNDQEKRTYLPEHRDLEIRVQCSSICRTPEGAKGFYCLNYWPCAFSFGGCIGLLDGSSIRSG